MPYPNLDNRFSALYRKGKHSYSENSESEIDSGIPPYPWLFNNPVIPTSSIPNIMLHTRSNNPFPWDSTTDNFKDKPNQNSKKMIPNLPEPYIASPIFLKFTTHLPSFEGVISSMTSQPDAAEPINFRNIRGNSGLDGPEHQSSTSLDEVGCLTLVTVMYMYCRQYIECICFVGK